MMQTGNKLVRIFNDLIFPDSCLLCGQLGRSICQLCEQKIVIKPCSVCPICKEEDCRQHSANISRLWALAKYHDWGINSLITNIKYRYQTDLLSDFWHQKLNDFYQRNHCLFEDRLIIPIPLHRIKLLRRGFNQSELIAEILAKLSGSQLEKGLLIRFKNNNSQAGSKGQERLENVKDIFRVDYRSLSEAYGRKILLVDDVYTTGATVLSAAGELRKCGFKEIDCLVLAFGK